MLEDPLRLRYPTTTSAPPEYHLEKPTESTLFGFFPSTELTAHFACEARKGVVERAARAVPTVVLFRFLGVAACAALRRECGVLQRACATRPCARTCNMDGNRCCRENLYNLGFRVYDFGF